MRNSNSQLNGFCLAGTLFLMFGTCYSGNAQVAPSSSS